MGSRRELGQHTPGKADVLSNPAGELPAAEFGFRQRLEILAALRRKTRRPSAPRRRRCEALNGDVVLPDRLRPTVSQDTGWFWWSRLPSGGADRAWSARRRGKQTLARVILGTTGERQPTMPPGAMCSTGAKQSWYVVREIADPASTGATERHFDDIIGRSTPGMASSTTSAAAEQLSSRSLWRECRVPGAFSHHYRFVAGYNLARREILVVDSRLAFEHLPAVGRSGRDVRGQKVHGVPDRCPRPPVAPDG